MENFVNNYRKNYAKCLFYPQTKVCFAILQKIIHNYTHFIYAVYTA